MQSRIRNTIYTGCLKFFRARLLTSSPERIEKIIQEQDKEVKSIREDALKMSWHMRGGLTYNEAMNLGIEERKAIGEIIKEHMETTKKTGLPYF